MDRIIAVKNQKFKVVTLGCRTNQYESQAYVDQLKALGYSEATGSETAEICIVNTCTVTESADRSSRSQIRQLARENPGTRLIVTGCLAEGKPQEIAGMTGVEGVVSNRDKENLLQRVFPGEEIPEFQIREFEAHTRAFVKVQDGCNSFCSYCIIPYVRGRSRSRRLDEILEEVRGLIQNGYQEVVLTGINVGDFDGAPREGELPVRLADLVRAVDALEGLKRLRVSSIDPDEVDEDLASAILHGKNTCPSMHIVLQAGSNGVLKRMNRKYTREIFLDTVERLRTARPDFTFTTDIIVGFPGESERDFLDTLEVMEEVRFAKVHMFPFSARERTRAALYPNKVAPEVIQERKQRLLRAAEVQAHALREKYVGTRRLVLVENNETLEGYIGGHTDNFLPVFLEQGSAKSNEIIEVEFIENRAEGLIGRVVR
ncbi:MAG: tRNA (N(6)-L-threonylcarbamoyladenosine(37)-C(2))-methylthiotransferase MtaB [Verrucomicrobia bacterium]|nr:tRNA (N(6)-L-threonylcarbamoyladenosine(37)-C(2))-methylthiotransferase MtaB [Verrucomicrobiota bacterium]